MRGGGQAYAEVNSDGSLFQKFQIEVPQGINKVQPDLQISYNSNIPNGLLGVGWNIEGLPKIVRVNSGNGIHFDGNDTYLGLQDLLTDISGNKSEYHTKNESFYRYKPIYGTCNLSSTEPCGWIVNSPDGNTMYFGEDENGSDGNSRVLSDHHSGYKTWSLRKFSDLHHNEYVVKYKINQGAMYPDTVIYNTSGFRYRVIRFNYEDRGDVERKYINGGLELTSQRLQSVEVASNALCVFGYCTDGDLIRKYKLGYKYSSSTYRSLLTQLQEFGTDGVTSLPPKSFMYSEPDMNTIADSSESLSGDFKESFSADVNNDGLTDLVRYSDTGSEIKIGYQLSDGQTFQPITGVQSFALTGWKLSLADLNGDGQKDLIFIKGTSVKYSLWVNSGWNSVIYTANTGDEAAIGWSISASDINMDGIDDLVYSYNYHDNSTPACPSCARKVQIDIQFNSVINSVQTFSPLKTIFVDNTLNDEWFIMPANLNDDSTMDFILANYKNGVTVNYILSDGNSYQTIKNAYTLANSGNNHWMAIPSDYNGDGKTDLVYFVQNYNQTTDDNQMKIGYQISNGNGFDGYIQYTTLSRNGVHALMPIDLNGDGKADFLLRKYDTDYCKLNYSIIFNKENDSKTPVDYYSRADNTNGASCKMNLQMGDFNGDGITDIAHTRFNGSVEDKIFYSFATNYLVDKLTSMTNGFGTKIEANYKPVHLFLNAVKSDASIYCGSSNFDYNGNCGLPYKGGRYLVFKETISDGRGGNYAKSYDYTNGRFKPGRAIDFKMLGFEKFRATVESPGYYSVQIFNQNGDFARYPSREEWYNPNHELVRSVDTAYDSNFSTVFNTTKWIKLSKQTTTQYEGGQYAFTKFTQVFFNDYGQVVHINDHAENTETVDKYYTYATDANLWILNRLVEQKQVAANQIAEWSKFVYQNHDKISEQKYLNTSQTWINHGFQYDIYGNVIAETDPNGNVTQTRYDDVYHSLPVAQINALGQTTTVEYDSLYYHAIRTVDPNHNAKGSEFDVLHRITKIIYPGVGNYKQLVYSNTGDPNQQYLEIRYNNDSPEGYNYVKHYYDGLMRLYKKVAKGTVVNEDGKATFVDIITDYEFYDINDSKHTRESNPYLSNKNNPVYKTYTYDSLARLIKITSPEGASETISYGPNMVTRQDSRGNTEKVQIDSRERDIVRENYEGVRLLSRISYQIFPLKQISTDGDGHAMVSIYDTLGKTVEVNDPATGKWQYRYDNNGNTIEKIDPKNQSIFYQYDALNRVVHKHSNIQAPVNQNAVGEKNENEAEDDKPLSDVVTYSYDDASLQNSIGKLSHVADSTGKTTYGYDQVGNIAQMKKEIDGQIYSFSAKYNTEKRVTQITYPDGTSVSNHYTDAGYLRQVRYHDLNDSKPEGHPVTTYLGPNDNAELLRITGNGVRDLVKYDIQSFKPLSVQTIAKDSAGADITVRHLDYSMDLYGNMKSIVNELDASFSEYFQTDGLNRITLAKGIYGVNNYVYSGGGNLLQKGNKTLYYNDPMHPQSVTSDSMGNQYQYDLNGNTVSEYNNRCNYEHESHDKNECESSELSQNKQYFYNAENQLIKSVGQDGGISEFVYDFNGNRTIKRTRDGRSVYYFHFLSTTSPMYEIQTGSDHGFSQSSHRDHDKKHSLQTKYIYGSQSELAAQISSERINYASVYKNSETVNYLMASSNNFFGLTKGALFLTSWLHQGKNSGKLYFVFTLFVIAAMLFIFFYYTLIKYRTFIFNYKQYRRNYRKLNPVYYLTMPVLLVVFVWQFGMGCGTFDAGAIPVDTTDNAFWSAFAGSIPDDMLSVSMPGETEEADQNGGYPVSGAYFFHADHLGSINLVTNVLGRVITELHYLPYGEIDRAHSYGPDILRYKYTHQEEDRESGKYNYNARMYNPESGRFTTADSELPGEGKQSQGFNRYMYTMGNPVRYNDSTGHCPEEFVCALPFQNFTGPTRRNDNDNYKSPCLTGVDCMSRGHDKSGALMFPVWAPRINDQSNAASLGMLYSNIVKDALWVAGGYLVTQTPIGIAADFAIGFTAGVKWMRNQPYGSNNFFLYMIAGTIFGVTTVIWDTLLWIGGTFLFTIDSVYAGLAIVTLTLRGIAEDIAGLISGNKSVPDILKETGQVFVDIGKAIGDSICGIFGC
ncbi:MAG: FG-GAP-like repeat-containing protein [Spirochaetia bacterium]|nr:FG-GAP-like repeat-containing protein [Spirochaetia bacterium]